MVPHVKTAWVDISVNAPVDSKENAVMKVTKKIKNKKNWKRNVTLFISSILVGSLVRRNCSFFMRIFTGSRNWEDTGLLLQISVNLSNSRLQQSLWNPKRHRDDWETDRQSNSNNNNNENNKTCIDFNSSDKFYHISLFFSLWKIYLFILIQFWSFNAWVWLLISLHVYLYALQKSVSVQLILNVKMAQRVSIPLAHISAFVHEDIKGNIAIKVSIL